MSEIENVQEIKERLVKIETLLGNLNKTDELYRQLQEEKIKLLEEQLKVANHRISDLEDTNKWIWRAIGGTLIGAIMAFLIK